MFKFGIFALILVLLSGCGEEKKQEVIEAKKPKVVKILNIEAQKSKVSFEYPAEVYAAQDTTMAFEVSGKIVNFNYKEGQKVSKGAVIASLDDTILRANFNSAQANYKQAQMDFNRYKKLFKTRSISKAYMEKTQQNLDVTKSAYEIAKKNLKETKLIAEFDGIIAKKIVDDFERVSAKQPIVLLQDTSYYKIKFFVPEHDILRIDGEFTQKNISRQASFYVTIGNGKKKTFKAVFVDITTMAESVTRTFETTLKIKHPKNTNILPGMTAKVTVIPKQVKKEQFFIPAQAIFSDENNQASIWSIDKDMRVHKKNIKITAMQGNNIQVVDGLANINKIVISGIRFLKENEKIVQYQKLGE